jgi:hypothetical protein
MTTTMKVEKVIFAGLPMRFEWRSGVAAHPTLCGFWRFIPQITAGRAFTVYKGSYSKALITWILEPFTHNSV